MTFTRLSNIAAAVVLGCGALATQAHATTQSVLFNRLTAAATVSPLLAANDTLFIDTLVTQETGAMSQSVTFSLGAGITSFSGGAAWMISTATGTGPRLIGVNIDIFNSQNNLVASDAFVGILGGFAHSTFASAIGPGTYRLVATGTGVRDSSLDIGLGFAAAVPEPETYALMLSGLAAMGLMVRRRRRD